VQGYEIHNGRTGQHPAMAPALPAMERGLAWRNAQGNVLGVYLHGMFECPAVLRALFGVTVPTLEMVFDGLADFVDRHFDPGVLKRL
jgi:adenosylcobyric acid synthase